MEESAAPKNKMSLNLDYRIVVAVLLVIIAAMLLVWKPWNGTVNAKDRTITVTGEAALKAEPDEFVFSPSYEFTTADKEAALKDLTAKSNEIVAALKKLGVPNSKIQTNANSWAYPRYDGTDSTPTYMLSLTVTVNDNKLVQKVEDYLLGTSPTGALTPQASFSTDKQKSLQSTARDKATKEARAKAEQSAKNLGFRLGAVKAVDDGSGFGGPIYGLNKAYAADSATSEGSSLTVQPGENTLNYSVDVTYYIK
jgi:uncharacterized protein YggE